MVYLIMSNRYVLPPVVPRIRKQPLHSSRKGLNRVERVGKARGGLMYQYICMYTHIHTYMSTNVEHTTMPDAGEAVKLWVRESLDREANVPATYAELGAAVTC